MTIFERIFDTLEDTQKQVFKDWVNNNNNNILNAQKRRRQIVAARQKEDYKDGTLAEQYYEDGNI